MARGTGRPRRGPPSIIEPFVPGALYALDELARQLNCRPQSIRNSRYRGKGPAGGRMIAGKLYFSGEEITSWLDGRGRRGR
jgi:hypothetical protein